MSETPSRFGQMIETVSGLRDILNTQIKQLHLHAFSIKHRREETGGQLQGDLEVYAVIGPMVHMAAISGLSMMKLTEGITLNVKDAFPVARSIVESVVNACYLMAEEGEAARAIRHAEFKSLRDLNRDWNAGSFSFSAGWKNELSAEAMERLNDLSSEFVTPKGRDRNWTEKSLRQRLDAASLKFDQRSLVMLSGSAFNIYNTASEVVHASYFSAMYFYGLTSPGSNPPRSSDEFHLTLVEHQFSVLMSVVLAYASFVQCFSSYSAQPRLLGEADDSLRQMFELPAIAEARR